MGYLHLRLRRLERREVGLVRDQRSDDFDVTFSGIPRNLVTDSRALEGEVGRRRGSVKRAREVKMSEELLFPLGCLVFEGTPYSWVHHLSRKNKANNEYKKMNKSIRSSRFQR